MILVTLGTQDKSFARLLKKIEELMKKGIITDEVIVQAGYTTYESDVMKIFDMTSKEELEELMKKADLIITHGGVGSILGALAYNKKVIAVPRLKKYKEHTNDHQKQIVKKFEEASYILAAKDLSKLDKVIEKSKTFKPKKYKSNQENFVKLIDNYIESTNHTSWFHRDYKIIGIAMINLILFFILFYLMMHNLIVGTLNIVTNFAFSSFLSYFFAIVIACFLHIEHLKLPWLWFLVFFIFDIFGLYLLTQLGIYVLLAKLIINSIGIIIYHFINKVS